jgi:energy-coupling factor transport system permease protein
MLFDYSVMKVEKRKMQNRSLDPRTKLLLAVFWAIGMVAAHRMLTLLVALGLVLAGVLVMGQGKRYLRWLRLVLPMAIFFGAVIWWSVDRNAGFFAALKLLSLTSAFFVFFSTTVPEDLGNSLVKIGLPYPIAFVLSTSLQYVPIMGRKIKNVLDAQRARGIPLEPGWAALRHYPAFFGPILIQSFQMAEELAEAMEARGFGRPGRTFLIEYRMVVRDWLALAAAGALLLAYLKYLS